MSPTSRLVPDDLPNLDTNDFNKESKDHVIDDSDVLDLVRAMEKDDEVEVDDDDEDDTDIAISAVLSRARSQYVEECDTDSTIHETPYEFSDSISETPEKTGEENCVFVHAKDKQEEKPGNSRWYSMDRNDSGNLTATYARLKLTKPEARSPLKDTQ